MFFDKNDKKVGYSMDSKGTMMGVRDQSGKINTDSR
jgi:hypothetical protein